MSTRGLYGFRKNGIDKCTYNHHDSYPEYLGRNFYDFCKELGDEGLNRMYDLITLVDMHKKPTEAQITTCIRREYTNFEVGSRSETDWYCLLRETQGNFFHYLRAVKENNEIFMINNRSFITDSVFCEYAYIANLDTGKFEVYKGFQKKPQKGNRYGTSPDEDGYYPCRLWKTYSLAAKRRPKFFDDDGN